MKQIETKPALTTSGVDSKQHKNWTMPMLMIHRLCDVVVVVLLLLGVQTTVHKRITANNKICYNYFTMIHISHGNLNIFIQSQSFSNQTKQLMVIALSQSANRLFT
jgi:hypothetical protein